jgi:hypothetical protein
MLFKGKSNTPSKTDKSHWIDKKSFSYRFSLNRLLSAGSPLEVEAAHVGSTSDTVKIRSPVCVLALCRIGGP